MRNINSHGENMKLPEIVEEILQMAEQGYGKKRIAKFLGISVKTVRKYLNQKEWQPYKPRPKKGRLIHLTDWLGDNFHQHKGNVAVLHQELKRQHNITISLRSVERAVQSFREQLVSKTKATIRFETPPGKQMQIDFGSMNLKIGGEKKRVYFFAAILGYSRKQYVQAFLHERQSSWLQGIEGAFRHFGGVTEHVLLDNARALVTTHNPATREVVFSRGLSAFANYWGFTPKACAPYRARTKGKDENTVKYIKKNAIAGREFSSWEALEEHLSWWMREVSDVRVHGTTGERPSERFERDEEKILRPINGKPPFHQVQEVERVVQSDACIEFNSNAYSVPWSLIRKRVLVQASDTEIRIFQSDIEVAYHPLCFGYRQRILNPKHLEGIIGIQKRAELTDLTSRGEELLRPLLEYEAAVGGWL